MRRAAIDRARTGNGFTLVEVLIALAVLAIGILGVAAMLLAGLRESRGALLQTEAATLAADIGERIRANRRAGFGYQLAEGTVLAQPPADCRMESACDPADLARLDLYEWQQDVLASLPAARTSVQVSEVPGVGAHLYVITVTWAGRVADVPDSIQLNVLA